MDTGHAPHHLAHGDIITLASGSDFVIAYVFRTDRGTASSPDQLIDLTSASSTTAAARTSQIIRPVINDAGEDGTIVKDGATARNGVTETLPIINRADDDADESPTYSAVGSVSSATLPGESRMRRYRSWLSSDDVAGRNVRPRLDALGVDAIARSPPRIPRRSQRLAARKEKPFWSVFNDNCTIS
ncbi:hypothetical protein SPRG_06798 [Saprolegnia parasitica CBS 223.65]|uniref:Uncharacterized protein n=1 Tax=Saprolegnia parasitica (strain CBS 223.65) TaxID=695850 RepID=A0A067CLU8_SAPPC|nr:hypothetical protein SPRG_06798 [Saprolegnia parasitica CBS 223.65]KDO27531.1 hypothetical protein SPRG_06798 [Saprolegnia parasitica CBS 223.65]|eukprot:XP_012201658.1 hypothetical protein SPRG_06798 [Saprolegnia parasitica CBS 223.65]